MMLAIALVVGGALASTAQAAGEQVGKGYNCLFIGHSFFVPVAGKLPPLAAAAGLVNHKQTGVFSGGATGTPLALWNNAQKSSEIKKELDTGDVELFGMTYEGSAPTTEGYERWIEYALAKNKDTIFMVGIPWKDFPAEMDTANYTAAYRTGLEGVTALFTSLRAKFPGTTFIENIYGTAAVELRLLFDQGKLPDVKQLTGDKATSLFKDSKGHAGVMLLDLASLFFLKRIYGVDPSKVSSDFSAYSTDLKAVAQSVLDAQDAQDAFSFCAPSDASCPGRSGGSTGGDAEGSTTPVTTAAAQASTGGNSDHGHDHVNKTAPATTAPAAADKALLKAAVAATKKSYADAGCEDDAAKPGCADMKKAMDAAAAQLEKASGAESGAASSGLAATAAAMAAAGFLAM